MWDTEGPCPLSAGVQTNSPTCCTAPTFTALMCVNRPRQAPTPCACADRATENTEIKLVPLSHCGRWQPCIEEHCKRPRCPHVVWRVQVVKLRKPIRHTCNTSKRTSRLFRGHQSFSCHPCRTHLQPFAAYQTHRCHFVVYETDINMRLETAMKHLSKSKPLCR